MTVKLRVIAHALNLREKPSIDGEIVGFLKSGQVVDCPDVSKGGIGWRYVVTDAGKAGYASLKYLRDYNEPPHEIAVDHPWVRIALGELGVAEVPGSGDNPRIVEYLKSTTLDRELASNDETPWCAAFVNWCMEMAGYAAMDSAWAKSWLKWGRRVLKPERGAVVVFTRDGGGHVAFYMEEDPNDKERIMVLGGNQGNKVCVASYPKSRVLGYRMPSHLL